MKLITKLAILSTFLVLSGCVSVKTDNKDIPTARLADLTARDVGGFEANEVKVSNVQTHFQFLASSNGNRLKYFSWIADTPKGSYSCHDGGAKPMCKLV